MNSSSAPLATEASAVTAGELRLRPLQSPKDYAACVQLQRETWGENYLGTVPASMLKVSQMLGGVNVGAFAPDGRLVGFVYGLTGLRDGRVIHWSHMLAVHPAFRNQGLGQRLKEYQREGLRGSGVDFIYWTFDPLVARNAHFNLNRLQVRVCEYMPDMYGDTGSELHAFGTDRFIVSWPVVSYPGDAGLKSRAIGAEARAAPVADGVPGGLSTDPAARDPDAVVVRLEIPQNIEAIAADSLAEARAWRAATRSAFVRWLGRGLSVTGFFREESGRCFYVLSRTAASDESRCSG